MDRRFRVIDGVQGTDEQSIVSDITEVRHLQQSSAAGSEGHGDGRGDVCFVHTLCGRQQELQVLFEARDRVMVGCSSVAVLVHGSSGCGKSSLVESLRHPFAKDADGAIFVSGKFDQLRRNDPYSAIVEVFTDLCDVLLRRPSTELKTVRARLKEDTYRELSRVIYNLDQLLCSTNKAKAEDTTKNYGPSSSDAADSPPESRVPWPSSYETSTTLTSAQNCFTLLKQQFCSFLCHAAAAQQAQGGPVCLFFDDLQWADDGSLDIISSLVHDLSSQYVLILCAYRNEDNQGNDENDEICSKLGLSDSSGACHLPVLNVKLGGLDLTSVNEIVARATMRDPNETNALSKVVMRKTGGNAYFIEQFLILLKDEGMLTLDEEDNTMPPKWSYDMDRIIGETNVCDNVVHVVITKIRRQPNSVKYVLKLAACCGHYFDTDTIEALGCQDMIICHGDDSAPTTTTASLEPDLDSVSSTDGSGASCLYLAPNEVAVALHYAVNEGLIESCNNNKGYKFSHDRVQQTLYDMVKAEPQLRSLMHLRIGRIAKRRLSKVGITCGSATTTIFMAADNMNIAVEQITIRPTELMELVKLNIRAGRLSASKSNYKAATSYVRQALSQISHLADDPWELAPMLELSVTAAEIECKSGNFVQAKTLATDVLRHAAGCRDRLRAQNVQVQSLGSQGELEKAIEYASTVLQSLGIRVWPAFGYRALSEFVKCKLLLHGKSDEELVELPLATDQSRIAAMTLLAKIATYVFFQDDMHSICMVAIVSMIVTLQFGLTSESVDGFGAYSMLLASVGRYTAAYRFGKLGRRIANRLNQNGLGYRAAIYFHSFISHWKRPLTEDVAALRLASQSAMMVGDVEFALRGALHGTIAAIHCGISLETVGKDLDRDIRQMRNFRQNTSLSLGLPYLQLVKKLAGRSEPRSPKQAEDLPEASEVSVQTSTLCELMSSCFFADWKSAKGAMKNFYVAETGLQSHASMYIGPFYGSLTYFALYHDTRKRSYFWRGKKLMRSIMKWSRSESPTCQVLHNILLAELITTRRKSSVEIVECAFCNAIAACRNAGFQHLEALSLERAFHAFYRMDNYSLAIRYLNEAADRYEAWGAEGKIRQLERDWESLIYSTPFQEETPAAVPSVFCMVGDEGVNDTGNGTSVR